MSRTDMLASEIRLQEIRKLQRYTGPERLGLAMMLAGAALVGSCASLLISIAAGWM